MKRFLAILLLLAPACYGQTTVNLTVQDTPDNQTWNNGTWTVKLIGTTPGQTSQFNILSGGGSLSVQSGSLSSTGTASMSLPANANIAPSSIWQFAVCSQLGTACSLSNVTVTTSSPQTLTITPPSIRVAALPNLPPIVVYTTTEVSIANLGAQVTVVGSTPSTPSLQSCSVISGSTCTSWVGVGNGAQVGITNTWTASQNFDADQLFKGPNPYIDVRRFGARSVNPNATPQIPGITATCNGTTTLTLSSASTFQNGDGIVVFNCGAAHSMTTPSAPTVTPSISLYGTGTFSDVNGPTGATTYNYKVVARDRPGGLTAASAAGSTTTGASALGAINVNITSGTRSGQTVTVTTAATHPLLVGCAVSTCGEVFIGGGNGCSDATFRGWFTVSTAANGTTFTYVGPPSTVLDATTSFTGCTATFYSLNKVTWTAVAGAYQYGCYCDRANPGTFALIGVSNPSTTGAPDLECDDFGSPMMDNQAFPAIWPATAPASATNDSLSTTIASGAGTATLTLANAAGSTASGQTILFDDAPAFKAAAAFIGNSNQGCVYIPADLSGNQFIVNSWITIQNSTGIVPFCQSGPLYLNDTFEIMPAVSGAFGNKWIGDFIPQGASLGSASWNTAPTVTVNSAHPGFLFSGTQHSWHFKGINFAAVPANGTLDILLEGGFNQTVEWVNFTSGSGANDYMSQGIRCRTITGQANANFTMDFVGFAPGGGSDGVSHTPAALCPAVSIPHAYMVHRGLLINTGAAESQIGVNGKVYMNGGGTPMITATGASNFIIGSVTLDTVAQPCIAALTPPSSFAAITFLGALCVASSGVLGVSGNYFSLSSPVGNPTFANSFMTLPIGNGNATLTGQQINTNQLLGANSTVMTRTGIMAAPGCAVAAGGAAAVGSWTVKIVPVWQNGGEGTPSLASTACVTSTGNQTLNLTWVTQLGNIKGYNAYVSFNGGTYSNINPGGGCVSPTIAATATTASYTGTGCGQLLNTVPLGGPTTVGPGTTGSIFPQVQAANLISNGGACTNAELALSAGWQSTGSATVTAAAGLNQTCSWTITTGTTTAANPTITDTLQNALPSASTVCEMNVHGGTHTAAAGEGFQQTTLSATAPIFTFNGTPTAGGTTYFITRRCGP